MRSYYYNKIAHDYHIKRKKPWKALENFLSYLAEKKYTFTGYCIDLGCANGRNFKSFKNSNNKLIGIDKSLEFLNIARDELNNSTQYSKIDSTNIQIILGGLKHIPIRTSSIQNIFSIATIHHIKGKTERKKVLTHISDLLSKDGYFLLTVWRRWQKKFKKYFISDLIKRIFNLKYRKHQKELKLYEFGDKYVPWTISKEKKTYNRFYHFFSKREVKKLLRIFKIKEFSMRGGSSNKDNFFILAKNNSVMKNSSITL